MQRCVLKLKSSDEQGNEKRNVMCVLNLCVYVYSVYYVYNIMNYIMNETFTK